MKRFPLALLSGLLFLPTFAPAADWPRWLGAENDSDWKESGIVEDFSAGDPEVLWRVPVGWGYSGPAVADGRVYLMDYEKTSGEVLNNPGGKSRLEGRERVLCFDRESGELLWSHSYDRPYFLSYAGGPRCTPTVGDGKVFALGAEGNVTCLDAKSGEVIWARDLVADYDTETPIWGFSAHPLLHGDTLYCVVGGPGSVAVAFDKDTGEEKWRALSAAEPGYCPPTMIRQAGVDQLLIWHPEAINALNPATGDVYWSLPLKPSFGMSIMSPRKSGDLLFASGIGRVGALMRLGTEEPTAEFVWRAKPKEALFAANCTPYILGDHIYGPDIDTSELICARLSDGARVWTNGRPVVGEDPAPRGVRHGTAFLTRNTENGLFYIFNENGDLIIAHLSPEGYEEKGVVSLLEATNEAFGRPVVWSSPAFAGRSIFVRNDKELIRCDLSR